jgi:sulfite oxidase
MFLGSSSAQHVSTPCKHFIFESSRLTPRLQRCKGWAYSGGGRWPERVELSADGGFRYVRLFLRPVSTVFVLSFLHKNSELTKNSWYNVPNENMSKKHKWTWRTWEFDVPCDVEGWVEVVCRCWDNSLNTQPLTVRAAWNWGLHVTSSAHRISVYSISMPFFPIRKSKDSKAREWSSGRTLALSS